MLETAVRNRTDPRDMPKTIYIFSDMEFDGCVISGPAREYSYYDRVNHLNKNQINTVIEAQVSKWRRYGYEVPKVIFWNLDARHENIPAIGPRFSYVSGFSMTMVSEILSGKTGVDLMLEKLDGPRYRDIKSIRT